MLYSGRNGMDGRNRLVAVEVVAPGNSIHSLSPRVLTDIKGAFRAAGSRGRPLPQTPASANADNPPIVGTKVGR